MLFGFYFLLMLRVGQCTDDQIFVTETVDVGNDVTLKCPQQTSQLKKTLFWFRLVAGNVPEFLGGTFNFDHNVVNKTPRITAKQEPETFVLRIDETKLSDTGLYYCIEVDKLNLMFLKGTFLRVKGPEPDITVITQDFPPDPVRPGDSVSLQCSVLSDSDSQRCSEEQRVFWFRTRSDESPHGFIYPHGNSDGCDKGPETLSPQKCVYSFSKNISSSDAGTYYCAVATCGEILFGNGTKLTIEDDNKTNSILLLLSAALAVSFIVIVLLIYSKRKPCDCCNAADALQTNVTTASSDQQSQQQRNEASLVYSTPNFTSQQRNEASLLYSTPNFTSRKVGNRERKNASEEETAYSEISIFNN